MAERMIAANGVERMVTVLRRLEGEGILEDYPSLCAYVDRYHHRNRWVGAVLSSMTNSRLLGLDAKSWRRSCAAVDRSAPSRRGPSRASGPRKEPDSSSSPS